MEINPENNFSFWKKLLLTSVFFTITPLTILTSLFTLSIVNAEEKTPKTQNRAVSGIPLGVQVFASLPQTRPSIKMTIETSDARVEIVRQYLKYYNSILEPHAATLVEAADHYGLDFRLLPAIAQQESNLCKWIPPGGHNCWGWGIHSEGTLGFDSFDKAIWTVASGLKKEYIDKGYITPIQIMSKYTPKSNGSWANGVTQFMEELQ